jgi:hypothetical protein
MKRFLILMSCVLLPAATIVASDYEKQNTKPELTQGVDAVLQVADLAVDYAVTATVKISEVAELNEVKLVYLVSGKPISKRWCFDQRITNYKNKFIGSPRHNVTARQDNS